MVIKYEVTNVMRMVMLLGGRIQELSVVKCKVSIKKLALFLKSFYLLYYSLIVISLMISVGIYEIEKVKLRLTFRLFSSQHEAFDR